MQFRPLQLVDTEHVFVVHLLFCRDELAGSARRSHKPIVAGSIPAPASIAPQ